LHIRTTDEELLSGLEETRETNPDLGQTIDFHAEVIRARSQIQAPRPELDADEREVARLIDDRTPLVQRWEPVWDLESFTTLAARICDIGGRHRVELAPSFDDARGLVTADTEQSRKLVSTYLAEGKVDLPELSEETRGVLSFVLIHAVHPYMVALSSVLSPFIKDEHWYQRLCPVCGGDPDFGYLEKEVGGLHLLCSRCDTVWTYKRGECTFCGNSEKETFAYYIGDDEVYRLYLCDKCKRYLKVLDGRQISLEPVLPVQRIMTIGVDISARQAGYR
jgi:FdhE protein